MNIRKEIVSHENLGVNFLGLTLLSKEEYSEIKGFLPSPEFYWWWLRSPGQENGCVLSVDCYGGFRSVGAGVVGAVRPALILSPDSTNLELGDKFEFFGKNWLVVSEKYALCSEFLSPMVFREKWRVTNASNYEKSDIKKYLDELWEEWKNADSN